MITMGSNDSQDFSIGKASSTTVVTVTGAPFTYTGLAQTPATVSVTGAGGLNLHRLLIMQTTPMEEASYTFVGDALHTVLHSQDFSTTKWKAVSTRAVNYHACLYRFSTNSSYRKCNRCRRIKPYTDC
jgi:hypothetical protein